MSLSLNFNFCFLSFSLSLSISLSLSLSLPPLSLLLSHLASSLLLWDKRESSWILSRWPTQHAEEGESYHCPPQGCLNTSYEVSSKLLIHLSVNIEAIFYVYNGLYAYHNGPK